MLKAFCVLEAFTNECLVCGKSYLEENALSIFLWFSHGHKKCLEAVKKILLIRHKKQHLSKKLFKITLPPHLTIEFFVQTFSHSGLTFDTFK
jgi:hypothetical protein